MKLYQENLIIILTILGIYAIPVIQTDITIKLGMFVPSLIVALTMSLIYSYRLKPLFPKKKFAQLVSLVAVILIGYFIVFFIAILQQAN